MLDKVLSTRTRKGYPFQTLRSRGTVWLMTSSMYIIYTLCPGRCPLFLLFILAALGQCVDASAIRNSHMMRTYVHNGTICFKCGPGTLVSKHCTRNFTYSDCDPCPDGQYQSHYTQASRCQQCDTNCFHDANMEIVQNCSATENRKCECKLGYFREVLKYIDVHHCMKFKECPHGQVVVKNGTTKSDVKCGYCLVGQYYKNDRCENCTSCTDKNMTVISPCGITTDALCEVYPSNSTSNTSIAVNNTTDVQDEESTRRFVLVPVLVPVISLAVIAVLVIGVLWYCKRSTKKKNRKSIELNRSCTSPLLRESEFHELRNMELSGLLKQELFHLLSERLTRNWKRFMALLPGDERYHSVIENRCEQIVMEEPGNVPEQIYKALREWAQSHDSDTLKVDAILCALSKLKDFETRAEVLQLARSQNTYSDETEQHQRGPISSKDQKKATQ